MIGRVEETSASFEARSAPRLYPTRGSGQYLYDRTGVCYLDLLSGFGVFAIGRNHAVLRDALKSVLESELPNLVQMDVSTLAGILAERLLARVPYLDKVFFANSGAESVEAAIKFARAATRRPGIVPPAAFFFPLLFGLSREDFPPALPQRHHCRCDLHPSGPVNWCSSSRHALVAPNQCQPPVGRWA